MFLFIDLNMYIFKMYIFKRYFYMCIYRVRFASGSSKNKVKKKGFITVYLQSMGLVRGNHQDISKHSWVSIPFVKIYPTTGLLEREHWVATFGQCDFTSLGKTEWAKMDTSPWEKTNIGFILCLISLSPFLSLTPEFRCKGLVIYMVIGANINRSLRVLSIVFVIPNRTPRNTQKTRDLQREQVLKEDKRTDVQENLRSESIWDQWERE